MTRTISKVIPAEQLEDIESWRLPSVNAPGGRPQARSGTVTARQLEEIQKQAYQEGFERGKHDGLQAAQKQIAQRVAELGAVMQTLAQPLAQLDQDMEQQLVTLALTVARQLIRRELKTEPGEVLAVIREALGLLPLSARNVRLHLNPEDAELVRTTLTLGEHEPSWRIVEDPVLSRGGCRVSADNSQIDATLENRLNAVIAQTLGGLRQTDNAAPQDGA